MHNQKIPIINSEDLGSEKKDLVLDGLKTRLEQDGLGLSYLAHVLTTIPKIDEIIDGDYSDRLLYQYGRELLEGKDPIEISKEAYSAFSRLSKIHDLFEDSHKKYSKINEDGFFSPGWSGLDVCFRAFYDMAAKVGIDYKVEANLSRPLISESPKMDCDLLSFLFNQLASEHLDNLSLILARPHGSSGLHVTSCTIDDQGDILDIIDMTAFISTLKYGYHGLSVQRAASIAIMSPEKFSETHSFSIDPISTLKNLFMIVKTDRKLHDQLQNLNMIGRAMEEYEKLNISDIEDKAKFIEEYYSKWQQDPADFVSFFIYARTLDFEIMLNDEINEMADKKNLSGHEKEYISELKDRFERLAPFIKRLEKDLDLARFLFGDDLVSMTMRKYSKD